MVWKRTKMMLRNLIALKLIKKILITFKTWLSQSINNCTILLSCLMKVWNLILPEPKKLDRLRTTKHNNWSRKPMLWVLGLLSLKVNTDFCQQMIRRCLEKVCQWNQVEKKVRETRGRDFFTQKNTNLFSLKKVRNEMRSG